MCNYLFGSVEHLLPFLTRHVLTHREELITVDATVSTEAVISRLLSRLPDNGNELVLFDINRAAVMSILLVSDPGPLTDLLMRDASPPFSVRLIASENPNSTTLVAKYKPPLKTNALFLGQAEIRGERGLMKISSDW